MDSAPSSSLLYSFANRVHSRYGLSSDLVFVGALSEEFVEVDMLKSDAVGSALYDFSNLLNAHDLLSFVDKYGLPLPAAYGLDWEDGYLPSNNVRACLDLAATFRLIKDLVYGLADSNQEHLLFDNLFVGRCTNEEEAYYVLRPSLISRSTLADARKYASTIEKHKPFPRYYEDLFVFFRPRNYDKRWSASMTGRLDEVPIYDTGSIFSEYRIDDYECYALTEIKRAAASWVLSFLNKFLVDIHPRLVMLPSGPITQFQCSNFLLAMAWWLYLKYTGVSSQEKCPHPRCTNWYAKTRKDKSSCGSPRCAQWVYRQARNKKES